MLGALRSNTSPSVFAWVDELLCGARIKGEDVRKQQYRTAEKKKKSIFFPVGNSL